MLLVDGRIFTQFKERGNESLKPADAKRWPASVFIFVWNKSLTQQKRLRITVRYRYTCSGYLRLPKVHNFPVLTP